MHNLHEVLINAFRETFRSKTMASGNISKIDISKILREPTVKTKIYCLAYLNRPIDLADQSVDQWKLVRNSSDVTFAIG